MTGVEKRGCQAPREPSSERANDGMPRPHEPPDNQRPGDLNPLLGTPPRPPSLASFTLGTLRHRPGGGQGHAPDRYAVSLAAQKLAALLGSPLENAKA